MKVLVIGASGNTGIRVMRLLTESTHDGIAMIRDAGQRPWFDALGCASVLADLEYPIDHAFAGVDACIFAAGSGGKTGKDKTVLVDHLGAIRSIVTAQVHGVERYVMLSSINNDLNSKSPIAHYHIAKKHADNFLERAQLAYTIVCPGGLVDTTECGGVEVATELHGRGTTSRETLAHALVRCLDLPNTERKAFRLLDGADSLENALRTL